MNDAAQIAANVQAKLAAREAAQARAQHLIANAENLEAIVKSEVGRRVSEHLGEVQANIIATLNAIERRKRVSRMLVKRALTGLSNKLAILSAAYQSGALPK